MQAPTTDSPPAEFGCGEGVTIRTRSHVTFPLGAVRPDRENTAVSGNYYSNDPDEYEFGQQETGSGLRKQLEEALGEIRSLRQELTDAKRGETVDALLKEKGIDPAVKDIMPKDANPAEWLDKYAPLFGKRLDASEVIDPPEVVVAPDLQAEQNAQTLMQPGSDAAGGTTTQQDPFQQLAALKNEEEFLNFLNQQKGTNFTGNGLLG